MKVDYTQRIMEVVAYIEENISEKINLAKLAEISNFSKYHFSRIFKSITGLTPMDFLNQKRLQKAMDYLSDPSKSILEIANLCGFESISSFNASFKKHYQKPPSLVRKELCNNLTI